LDGLRSIIETDIKAPNDTVARGALKKKSQKFGKDPPEA
jgi:hypothetical protein